MTVTYLHCDICGGTFRAGQRIDYSEGKVRHEDERDHVWGAAIGKTVEAIRPVLHGGDAEEIDVRLSGGIQIRVTGVALFGENVALDVEVVDGSS